MGIKYTLAPIPTDAPTAAPTLKVVLPLTAAPSVSPTSYPTMTEKERAQLICSQPGMILAGKVVNGDHTTHCGGSSGITTAETREEAEASCEQCADCEFWMWDKHMQIVQMYSSAKKIDLKYTPLFRIGQRACMDSKTMFRPQTSTVKTSAAPVTTKKLYKKGSETSNTPTLPPTNTPSMTPTEKPSLSPTGIPVDSDNSMACHKTNYFWLGTPEYCGKLDGHNCANATSEAEARSLCRKCGIDCEGWMYSPGQKRVYFFKDLTGAQWLPRSELVIGRKACEIHEAPSTTVPTEQPSAIPSGSPTLAPSKQTGKAQPLEPEDKHCNRSDAIWSGYKADCKYGSFQYASDLEDAHHKCRECPQCHAFTFSVQLHRVYYFSTVSQLQIVPESHFISGHKLCTSSSASAASSSSTASSSSSVSLHAKPKLESASSMQAPEKSSKAAQKNELVKGELKKTDSNDKSNHEDVYKKV
jgi:hypothetical protein